MLTFFRDSSVEKEDLIKIVKEIYNSCEVCNRFKKTPMMNAAHVACRETVATLLSLGADVDAVNVRDRPALYFALLSGDTGTVEMLCDKTHSGKTGCATSSTFMLYKFICFY